MVHESFLQVVGHFNQLAWNCDLHKGYVMEANEKATTTYNWMVISTQNLQFTTKVVRGSTPFNCDYHCWMLYARFPHLIQIVKTTCWIGFLLSMTSLSLDCIHLFLLGHFFLHFEAKVVYCESLLLYNINGCPCCLFITFMSIQIEIEHWLYSSSNQHSYVAP
jgi:hypothetical protein